MTEPREQPSLSEEEQAEFRQSIDEAAAAQSGGTLFAVVNGNGTLARGLGAVSASRIVSGGSYQVIFNRNITKGAFVATIGLSADSGQEQPGQILVNLRAGTTNGVFVQTSDSAGTNADRSFHLLVALP